MITYSLLYDCFGQELCAALGGTGTDDDSLIRVITTRAEVDMQAIKLEFLNECKKTLEEMIASDTVGSYRCFLLTLVGPGDVPFSPRTSNSSASFFSPRSSGSRQQSQSQSQGSQNGSGVSYYSPRTSSQGSFQV